jgi:methylmalonyl-CoA/ethylmalonyl-CoA epimerase
VKLDHVAVATGDLAGAIRLWGEALSGKVVEAEISERQGFAQLVFEYENEGRVEVLAPLADVDGFLQRFIDRQGEGMHHVTFHVDDLRNAVVQLREAGYRIVGESYEDPEWMEAFISPRSAGGVLVQLAQSSLDRSERDARSRAAIEQVLSLAADGEAGA